MLREEGTMFIELWDVVVDQLVHQAIHISDRGVVVEHPLSKLQLEMDTYGFVIDG